MSSRHILVWRWWWWWWLKTLKNHLGRVDGGTPVYSNVWCVCVCVAVIGKHNERFNKRTFDARIAVCGDCSDAEK